MKKVFWMIALCLMVLLSRCSTPNTPEVKEYQVTYEENGGSIVEDYLIKDNETIKLPEITKEGHTFKGWYLDSNYKAEATNTTITSNITLYAKWEVNTYNVKYENSELEDSKVEYNKTITKPTTPEKLGYTFKGWYSDSEYANSYDFNTKVKEDITLYAKWEINKYTVKFENITVEDIKIEHGSILPQIEIPERVGYTFKGFYTNSEYTNLFDINTNEVKDNITLYAKWEKNIYTVEFVDSEIESQTIEHNGYAEEPTEPVKEGYVFSGWYLDTEYIEKFNFESDKVITNIVLYAKWEIIEFTIILENSTLDNLKVKYNSLIPRPNSYIADNKIIIGWYKDIELKDEWNFNTKVKEDLTLYAKWEKVIIGDEGIKYKVNYDRATCSVSSYNGSATELIIGNYYNGMIVTSIENNAFNNCTSLINIIVPNGIKIIKYDAFKYCTSLKNIVIPESVTNIGDDAFYRCDSLTSIKVSEDNLNYRSIDGNLYSKDGKILIKYAGGKNSESFTIPEGVSFVEDYAIYKCKSLTKIFIPSSVEEIGYDVLVDCELLTNIEVSEGNLNYKSIDGNLYSKDGERLIRYAVGKKKDLFSIPEGVTRIGESAFRNCDSLKKIILSSSVKSVLPNTFYGCTSLENIDVSEENQYYKSIDGNLYDSYGTELVQYAIGKKNVSFVVPNTVFRIGDFAFSGCPLIESIVISENTYISTLSFFSCQSLTSISVAEGNKYFKTIEGNLYSKDGKTLIQYAIGKKNDTFIVCEGVEEIGYFAFGECLTLSSIILPDSVVKIDQCAFSNCHSLMNITITDNVSSIGMFAFANCTSLENITIPKGIKMGSNVFEGCNSLTIYCEKINSLWNPSWNSSNRPVILLNE